MRFFICFFHANLLDKTEHIHLVVIPILGGIRFSLRDIRHGLLKAKSLRGGQKRTANIALSFMTE
jgi:hypothetical protein